MTKLSSRFMDEKTEKVNEIPSHWKVSKLKYLFDNLDYKRIPLSSEERGNMVNRKYDYYGASGVIDRVEDYLFDEPLILIGEDGANLYSRSTPLAFVAEGKYWVNNHAHILRPKNGNLYFWANLLESIDYSIYITGSAQPKLTQDALANIQLPVPPLVEQETIWSYLEQKLSNLDHLINSKQDLIVLIEEKRQAIIKEAVTKGLNANVKMKGSGVEWIDQMPVNWKRGKLSYFSKVRSGGTPDKNNEAYWNDGNINWMSSGEINKEFVSKVNNKITFEGFNNSNATMLPVNTVMMALNGQGKTKGKVAVLEIVTTCNQSLAGFITDESRLHYLFLYYYLKSKYRELRGLVGDGLRDGLTIGLIKSLQIPLPPIKEQKEIASVLKKQDEEFNELIKKVSESIEKLKEYRQSLIYEAVTGKIDVRDYEAIQ
ncbi:hypothetical protein SLU01_11660 [Sporosarcina luteola]|uniref:Type I restriction modification DNA specificity domain-containing protein n=1 Tax=Sporosarcina luteola TaxID=582850 RepID=A0A511Z5Z1_9BACL|nr:restriction endonuclease subunit S [Sporosarcina luteola]GEN82854.1 hypothetical protein SLU01_11660 [Sporosarcina luteola]